MSPLAKSPSLTGSLIETSLPDLCQVLGQRTGMLRISEHGRQGSVFFNQGKVVHAELDTLYGRDAFLDLTLWKGADFEFISGPMPQYITIEDQLTGMIMDAAVYQDIWQDLTKKAIHEKSILKTRDSRNPADPILQDPLNQQVLDSFSIARPLDEVVREFIAAGHAKKDIITAIHDLVMNGSLSPSRPDRARHDSGIVSAPLSAVPAKSPATTAAPSHKAFSALKPVVYIAAGVMILLLGAGTTFVLLKNDSPPAPVSTLPETQVPANTVALTTPEPAAAIPQNPAPSEAANIVAPAPEPALNESTPELPPGALDALKTEELVNFEGREVHVAGKIIRTHKLERAGITFLDFRDKPKQGFVLVIFKNALDRFPTDPATAYQDKMVRVTGKISLYDGLPQIVVNHPNMIQIID